MTEGPHKEGWHIDIGGSDCMHVTLILMLV